MTTHTSGAADLPEALRAIEAIRKQYGKSLICCGCPVPGNPGDGWMQPPDPPECCQCPDGDVSAHLDVVVVALAAGQAVAPEKGITVDFSQAHELLEMFGGEPGLVTLHHGNEKSHSGAGLYAWWTDMPEEGAQFLGAQPDDEAAPARPAPPAMDGGEDAERYRWLRNPTTDVALVLDKRTAWVPPDDVVPGVGGYWVYEYRAGDELDAAIDAARAAQKEGETP